MSFAHEHQAPPRTITWQLEPLSITLLFGERVRRPDPLLKTRLPSAPLDTLEEHERVYHRRPYYILFIGVVQRIALDRVQVHIIIPKHAR